MYRQLLFLHRHLFYRLAFTDLILVMVGQLYIFGRGDQFLFVPNLAYFITFFLLFLSINIAQLRRFSGGANFYLNLPLSINSVILQFLLIRLFILFVLLSAISIPLFTVIELSQTTISYTFHVLLFGGLISVTSLPILILLSKSHPEGILLSLAYFLSFIPIWIGTTLCSEIIFKGHWSEQLLIPLIFLMCSVKIAEIVVRSVKV